MEEKLSAAFCHLCWQIFLIDSARCSNSKSEDAFISLGYKYCKKVVEKFKKNESCNASFKRWKFWQHVKSQNIAAMLNDHLVIFERRITFEGSRTMTQVWLLSLSTVKLSMLEWCYEDKNLISSIWRNYWRNS